jgi:hypothetical protein
MTGSPVRSGRPGARLCGGVLPGTPFEVLAQSLPVAEPRGQVQRIVELVGWAGAVAGVRRGERRVLVSGRGLPTDDRVGIPADTPAGVVFGEVGLTGR